MKQYIHPSVQSIVKNILAQDIFKSLGPTSSLLEKWGFEHGFTTKLNQNHLNEIDTDAAAAGAAASAAAATAAASAACISSCTYKGARSAPL